jgi:hypothetical protein
MLQAYHVLTVLMVAVGMGLALAHALEFPGKRRLDEGAYREVQRIYYPGFTVGAGIGEFGAMVALAALLFLLPFGSAAFWWAAAALGLLLAAHAVYWAVTHPVNSVWTRDLEMSGAGKTFFAAGRQGADKPWTRLRDTWEWSHVARAALFFLALAAAAASLGSA